MQIRFIISFLFSIWFGISQAQTTFNRSLFYSVLSSESLEDVDHELTSLKNSPEKKAFEGALLMKKSGLVSDPKDKLSLFKSGRAVLEQAIAEDSTNTEFRFLRLLVQERAPKLVHYNSEIKKDASYLRENYKNLLPVVQKAVFNYSKTSKELKPGDFNYTANE
jgi:hypothetical protein